MIRPRFERGRGMATSAEEQERGEVMRAGDRRAPPVPPGRWRGRLARALAVAVTAVPLAVALAAPAAGALGWPEAEAACRGGFRLFCHQKVERSLFLWGAPLAVCARCFGAWSGVAAGGLAAALFRSLERRCHDPRRSFLLGLVILAAAQPVATFAGLLPDASWLRFASAFPAAAACGALFVAAVVELLERRPVPCADDVSFPGAPNAEA